MKTIPSKRRSNRCGNFIILFTITLIVGAVHYHCQSDRQKSSGRGSEKSDEVSENEKKFTLAADRVSRLTGQTAVELTGAVDFPRPLSLWLDWKGPGSATWLVEAKAKGDYNVAFCYAASGNEQAFNLSSGRSVISGKMRKTAGSYKEGSLNYERILLEKPLRLSKGNNYIRLAIEKSPDETLVHLHSLELIPRPALTVIIAEQKKARMARVNTDWFVAAKYGVMFTWTSRTQPRHGFQKPYLDAVRDFDVERFAEMVEQTGAGYVIFSTHHGDHTCPMPLQSWECVYPGSTSKRDLINEMADALGRYGIKLLLYMSPNTIGKEAVDLAFWHEPNWPFVPVVTDKAYVNVLDDIFTEMGHRYREKLAGYWFDGFTGIYLKYPDFPYERLSRAFKAGNPNRLVSINTWVLPLCTDWQDYWCGEGLDPSCEPLQGRYLEDSQSRGLVINYTTGKNQEKGLQSHVLFVLDDNWVHTEPEAEIAVPRYSNEELIAFVKQCVANQCVVTMNMGIYQDGTVGPATLNQMKALCQAIRGK